MSLMADMVSGFRVVLARRRAALSNQAQQTGHGSADRPPIELPHPVRMRILGAVMVGVFLGALDQTVVGTALPRIITDLGGNSLYTWAFTAYLLTATISGPALRQALGPLRPATGVPVRHRRLHGRLDPVGDVAADVGARRRPRRPGPRRWRAVPDRDGRHRRPVRAVRARPLPGALRRGLRAVDPRRPGDRRPDHRHDRLAVRVLRQPARRRGRARHRPALPAALPPGRRPAADRLPRARRCSRARSSRSWSA